MANYRPIVERLVLSSPERDAGARGVVYTRARAALEKQFRGDPKSVAQFEVERLALDEAIADIEAEHFAEVPPAEPAEDPVDRSAAPAVALSRLSPAPLRMVDAGRETMVDVSSPASRPYPTFRSAVAACALCALLVGAGATGWQLFRSHRHAAAAAEGDVETIDASPGAAVPIPIGSIEAATAGMVPSGVVAQRAALLIDDPQDPHRLRTYSGRVVWRLIRPEQSPGRTMTATVEADIDVPEAGFRTEVSFDKNASPELPASHTAQVRFARRPDSPVARIDRIGLPEMRDAEALTGVPLAGKQAKVTDDLFLIGLSDLDRKGTNLRLIRSRPWFDLPIMLEGHHEAKLTFEKGSTGDVVWTQAFSAWH